jgi:hypothetical protein
VGTASCGGPAGEPKVSYPRDVVKVEVVEEATMRPANHYLSISAVRADALFVSTLQRSDEPTAGQIRQAVAMAVRAFGRRGCAERVAQEFGDHPETAGPRMHWARRMTGEAFGSSAAEPGRAGRPHHQVMVRPRRAA